MIRFLLVGDGIELHADGDDAATLSGLVEQFTGMLPASGSDDAPTTLGPDPALLRLFPDPMPDDPEESAELRELTLPSLLEHKRQNAELVAASLAAPGRLDTRAELAWLQWLTDVRLVLASRLGIVVDGDVGSTTTEADQAMQWTYHALGSLQGDLVELLDRRTAAGAA